MARAVAWTEAAWTDLERIVDHIALDSAAYAASFARRIRDAARSLSELARRGRVVPEWGSSDIRELIVGNYRLIYHVDPATVDVLALVHGARDLASWWESEDRKRTAE